MSEHLVTRGPQADADTVLKVEDLHLEYSRGWRKAPLHALRGVSLSVGRGETLAVVGESGSGKSTLGSAILGLHPARSGTITFLGRDISHAGKRERRSLGTDLQAVFQDPYSSMNPVRTIGQSLAEPLLAHTAGGRDEVRNRTAEILDQVGLPVDTVGRYPAEFSGGQRQRIAIARALISRPSLVVCDEPVSSLDVSVQAQVLNLLSELQRTTECSYLFISHNLTVVRHFSHRVLVLYRGMVMEIGTAREVCDQPQHPYTQALLAAVALPDPDLQRARRTQRLESVRSTPGDLGRIVEDSCPFASRCPHVQDRCRVERPALRTGRGGVQVACHFFEDLPAGPVLEGPVAAASSNGLDPVTTGAGPNREIRGSTA